MVIASIIRVVLQFGFEVLLKRLIVYSVISICSTLRSLMWSVYSTVIHSIV